MCGLCGTRNSYYSVIWGYYRVDPDGLVKRQTEVTSPISYRRRDSKIRSDHWYLGTKYLIINTMFYIVHLIVLMRLLKL